MMKYEVRNSTRPLLKSIPLVGAVCFLNTLLLLVSAFLTLGVSAPAAGMGKLSEYTKAIFDCPGMKLFGWGPTHSVEQTGSMEPVEICLYDIKTHRGLKLKIPAAYIEVIVKDEYGRPGVLGLQFWMPGFRPASAIPELRYPEAQKRLQYLNENKKNNVRLSLKYTPNTPGDPDYQRLREGFRWEYRADLGLEHYGERCERLSELKSAKRDISTRKCDASYSSEQYLGRSKVTNGSVYIQCNRDAENCRVNSVFEGHSLEFNILRTELSRLNEYEVAVDQFLHKYLIEKLTSGNIN